MTMCVCVSRLALCPLENEDMEEPTHARRDERETKDWAAGEPFLKSIFLLCVLLRFPPTITILQLSH